MRSFLRWNGRPVPKDGLEQGGNVIRPPRRVCLIGAGNVALIHGWALRQTEGVDISAVCDPDQRRARALAEGLGVEHSFPSVAEAVRSGLFDYAHVLVPPELHVAVGHELAEADIGMLIEKPLGIASAECVALRRHGPVPLGVNHNAVFFPAYLRMREHLRKHTVGALQHLTIVLNYEKDVLPNAQHWAMAKPQNLMFETGVHPLSQIYDLAGRMISAQTTVSGRHELGVDGHYFDTWQVSLQCERATAQLFLSYGGAYRTWHLTALCEDGVLTAEMEQNRSAVISRTRWGQAYEPLHVALSRGAREVTQGVANIANTALAIAQPTVRGGPYFMSMCDSIAAFHGPRNGELPLVDGAFGTEVVSMCEEVTKDVVGQPRRSRSNQASSSTCDVAVLGGTGFIGRSVVEQLVHDGVKVRVMARTAPLVERGEPLAAAEFIAGDISDAKVVDRVVKGARTVIHLAHGGRFTWEEVGESMIEPAELVAAACLQYRVERLVYTGTIASLYLGDPHEVVTGATPTDPRARERGPYEWGKAQSEAVLLRRHRDAGLPVTILRPGIVLGRGGPAFHSGFGQWRGTVHCVGWNAGSNPLPLVLSSDVACAILLACKPGTPQGRTFNVIGDVRLTARECVALLRDALRRPLVFHPRHPLQNEALRVTKWSIRALTGSRSPLPSYRGVKSMGCEAQFDCSDIQRELGWTPVNDREVFITDGLRVHGPGARGSGT